jgi:hypothetical protein
MALLRIEPEIEVHFWINDETPRCVVNLRQVEQRSPMAFRVSWMEYVVSVLNVRLGYSQIV